MYPILTQFSYRGPKRAFTEFAKDLPNKSHFYQQIPNIFLVCIHPRQIARGNEDGGPPVLLHN